MMISVIVPCYNCQDTLDKCCNSVLSQSSQNFEIILVDDGSKDSTGQICDEFAAKNQNISVIHQENAGLMAAWKKGVEAAGGEYVTFIDSDDWIEQNLIEKTLNVIQDTHADMVVYGITVDYDTGKRSFHINNLAEGYYTRKEIEEKVLPVYFSDGRMESAAIIPSRCSKVIKRELLYKNFPLLDNKFSIGEDDLTSFAVIHDVDSIYHIPNYYPYHYYRHSNSMMGNYSVATVRQFVLLRNELLHIADVKNYRFCSQIEYYFLDNVLITIKKIISNRNYKEKELKQILQEIYDIDAVKRLVNSNFDYDTADTWKHRIFYKLFQRKMFGLLIGITRIIAR